MVNSHARRTLTLKICDLLPNWDHRQGCLDTLQIKHKLLKTLIYKQGISFCTKYNSKEAEGPVTQGLEVALPNFSLNATATASTYRPMISRSANICIPSLSRRQGARSYLIQTSNAVRQTPAYTLRPIFIRFSMNSLSFLDCHTTPTSNCSLSSTFDHFFMMLGFQISFVFSGFNASYRFKRSYKILYNSASQRWKSCQAVLSKRSLDNSWRKRGVSGRLQNPGGVPEYLQVCRGEESHPEAL